MSVVGRGVVEGHLTPEEVSDLARLGLERLPLDGKRVIVLIPDGTRTMPMPLMFDILERELAPRVAALDFLVALGTHTPMSDEQLSRLIGRTVVDGRAGDRRIFNHRWDDPTTFATLGTIPAKTIQELSLGRLNQDVPVALNRKVIEYDHVLICGPVFPHEVVGFSGGTKYLFPGIAASEIIHFTHWLGALITSSDVLGTIDTPVRAVINRAAALLETPLSLLAVVVTYEGVAGVFCGEATGNHDAWRQAAALSRQASRRLAGQALRPRADGDAGDVSGPVDGGQGRLQDGAGRRRRRRGRGLRAARARGQPRARPRDQSDRVSLPGLFPRAVGPIRPVSARHPGALDTREGTRDL